MLPALAHWDPLVCMSLATSFEPSDMVQTTSLQTSEDSHGASRSIGLPLVHVVSLVYLSQTYPSELFHKMQQQLPFVLIEAASISVHKVRILRQLEEQHCNLPINVGAFHTANKMEMSSW